MWAQSEQLQGQGGREMSGLLSVDTYCLSKLGGHWLASENYGLFIKTLVHLYISTHAKEENEPYKQPGLLMNIYTNRRV